jgi:hypothetical protein
MAIKTYVTGNSTFTAADNNSQVIGAAGEQKVKILAGVTNVSLDANIEKIDLAGSLASYKFVDAPEGIKILNAEGATVALIPSLNQAATIAFSDGSAAFTQTATGAFALGSKVITTTAATITAADVVTFDTAVKSSVGSTSTGVVTGIPGTQLKTTQDDLVGTADTDSFQAFIFDNANTLQSGDKIDGGLGIDTLTADIGNSQRFAITPKTDNVENVKIRAQAISTDTTDNNTASTSEVQIDAERMTGVTHWESNNSRADLLIEDVRILSSQITKDITIAMVETDPGHVDFGFYFDQYSLRSIPTTTSSQVSLQLRDGLAPADQPLGNLSVNGLKIMLGGKEIILTSTGIDDAKTYDQFVTELQKVIAATPEADGLTVVKGDTFPSINNVAAVGNWINLSDSKGRAFTNVIFNDTNNSNGAFTKLGNWTPTPASVISNPVTSKVILDDVGRGSTGGDLVIGGLSVGDTSTSLGVERFEIEVLDNSKLQTINSTNNTLQEVTIKNGATSNNSFAYVTTAKNSGNLTVNGSVSTTLGNSNLDKNLQPSAVSATWATLATTNTTNTNYGTGINTALPGSAAQHNAYGFSDVRFIDASAMTGNLALTAEISARAVAKYTNLVDTQIAPNQDTLNGFGTGAVANFDYKGGAGNDTFVVDVNSDVAGSRSSLVSGREDFTFNVDGGAGNDSITLRVVNTADTGNAQNWYNNQDVNNNISVSGGTGDDTIRTPGAGDVRIDAGDGNDTVYTDNTGAQNNVDIWGATGYGAANATATTTAAVKGAWVFNTVDQVTPLGTAPTGSNYGATGRDIGDLRSDTSESHNFYNGKVVVTFRGIPTAAVTIAGTGFKTTDLDLNQAIKKAINEDVVLNKLLVVEDGAANSLVVKSLIDGVISNADLSVSVTNGFTTSGDLPASQLTQIGAAYGLTSANSTAANVHAAMTTAFSTFNGFGDYVTALANDGSVNIVGANSVTSSDNIVLPGTGNDVIVLGTTVGADVASSSNDTVVINTNFGTDTIVNFATAGTGYDMLDFTALGGTTFAGAGIYTTNNSINIGTVATTTTVTETQAVANLFSANNTAVQTHVYVAVDATGNTGKVYVVNDPIGASTTAASTATLQGTIDLATTNWSSLTAANFVNVSGTAGYNLLNGPTTLNGTTSVVTPPVVTPPVTSGTGKAIVPGVTTSGVVGTAEKFQFVSGTTTGSSKLNSFTVTEDSIEFDLPTASATITKLNGLNGFSYPATISGVASTNTVSVQANQITGSTVVNLGLDTAGNPISLELVGVADASLVNITVI